MYRIWIFCSLTLLLFVFPPSTLHACSGGSSRSFQDRLESRIELSNTIVIGQFVELDDTNTNGIFRVSEYTKGETYNEYITVSMNDIRNVENSVNVNRRYPCGINSIIYRRLDSTAQYILFLQRMDDGIYRNAQGFFVFPTEETTIDYSRNDDLLSLTLDDLRDMIVTVTGQAQAPDIDSIYPRKAPILLSDINDRHFILPVDENIPFPITSEDALMRSRVLRMCESPSCVVWSPNGLDRIHLLNFDDEPIEADEIAITQIHNVIGERVLMSPTSEAFAVWQADGLVEIFALWYPRYGFPDDRLSAQYTPSKVKEFQLDVSSLLYPAIWSPDGRFLVFSDQEGLWLLDIYSDNYSPQLIIPASHNVATARYFSPQGRYLSITDGTHHYNLDLVTGHELPDGYFSPQDRILLVFDTTHTNGSSLGVMYLAPNNQSFEYYDEVLYHQVQWVDDNSFLATISGFGYDVYSSERDGEAISTFIEDTFFDVRQFNVSGLVFVEDTVPYHVPLPHMDTFTYDTELGYISLESNGYTIRINRQNALDLSMYLSTPIEKVVWLPPVFYYETN